VSLANIADGLKARGHYAELMVGEESIGQLLRQRGTPVSVLPARNTGWHEVRALRRSLRRSGIRLVIADRPRDLRLAGLASPGLGVRLIYRYNVSRPRPPSDMVTRIAYRRVAVTVFRTETGARHVLGAARFMAQRPHRIISGGVDTRVFFPDSPAGRQFREERGLGNGPLLLAVGALMPEKRYSELFQIVSRLQEPTPLLICGEGRLEDELRALAAQLGIDARFLGFLPSDQLRAAYNAADVVVHPCAVETFGLSVSEAMACGCAIVAARGGALPEVLADTGLLVSPDDLDEFTRQTARLLHDPALRDRYGTLAMDRSREHFSLDRMIEEYERMLHELAVR
jgi:glycosyltransferase involved in cell wall biosynthesis